MNLEDVKKLKLKLSFRSKMYYEEVTGEAFALDGSITKTVQLLWCVIQANNPDAIKYDDFINLLDDPEIFAYLRDWLECELKAQGKFFDEHTDDKSEQYHKKKQA
jgi:hypothetical protein